ncbi:MAG: hypothetical protein LBH19_02970 [Dysgonamonadaceae bacterium]|jgi:hypothetical protein|nr:hypothetical protein [Dysgonamonadaceae bacterium]
MTTVIRTKTLVFDSETQMNQWLAGIYLHPDGWVKADLNPGDFLLIRSLSVSDYWWDGTRGLKLKSLIDLSDYLNETQTNSLINSKIQETPIERITREI